MEAKKKNNSNKKKTTVESKKVQPKKGVTPVKKEDKKPVIEEKKVTPVAEETPEEKEEKIKIIYKEKEKSLFSKILNIVLWIILFAWMAVCLVDFYKVSQEQDPMFCLKKETTTYDDGNVESCLGVGYKVYKYNRSSYSAIEFGPFWSKDRSVKESK